MTEPLSPTLDSSQSSAVSNSRAFWYSIVLLAIPATAIIASIILVQTAWFPSRSGNTYIASVGYGVTLSHADCEVLIAGDSSAMVGVVPSVVAQKTGLKTCNIAEFGGMEQVNGRMMLDEYLSKNARPRFIVFVYVPENIASHDTWTNVSHFEAILFRLRARPDGAFFKSLLDHPKESLSFMTLTLRLALQSLLRKPMTEEALHLREENLGWIAVPGGGLSACLPGHSQNPPDPAYIHSLRSTYGVQGTQVLVDVTPMPTCDADYDYYAPRLAGIIDNKQQKYPIELYNSSGRLHLIRSGAERFSEEVAQQIALRQKNGPVTP
ncbi:MAG: hypothetical protein JWM43_2315 [Acidobacteriaceae bacterium]|nr:hypothetical protein [Acidobacteriaceae bacterium]